MRRSRFLTNVPVGLLGLSLAVCVMATSAVALIFDAGFYSRGEIEQGVAETYGLSQSQLVPVNNAIVSFFGSDLSLQSEFQSVGVNPSFFSEREIIHMEDVRSIIRAVVSIQRGTAVAAMVLLGLLVVSSRRRFAAALGRSLVTGAIIIVVLVIGLGAMTLWDFSALFTGLHEMSFANDFWLLDPRTDHLIQMFPFGFWKNGMLWLVAMWLASGAVMFIGGRLLIGLNWKTR